MVFPSRRTLTALLLAAMVSSSLQAAPDQIWLNGDVHTADPSAPQAEAFALEDGRFVAVGSNKEVRALADQRTEVHNLNGKTVIPGIIDGHFHLFSWYELSRGVNLTDTNDIDTWVERVAAKAAVTPKGEWIVGGGWDHNAAGGEFPTAAQLDAVAPDHLVALGDIDHHTMWVNSKVMDMFVIQADSPNPPGGEIVKDPKTGEPTGILKETAAFVVWMSDAFRPSDEERDKVWQEALSYVNSLGITGLHNMGDLRDLDDLIKLVEEGRFPLRMWYGGVVNSSEEVAALLPVRERINRRAVRQQDKGPRLSLGYIKAVVDGVMSSRTAVLLDDYSDAPGEKGKYFISQDTVNGIVAAANRENIPVALHALGDGAVRSALDAFEASPKTPSLPNRIEHLELVQPEDLPRFAQLNVVASMQPQHAVMAIDPYVVQRIGDEREHLAYAWRSILNSGARLALSSDWPTADASPLSQLHAAINRQNLSGQPKGGWQPQQALNFEEALYAMTQQSADLSGWGNQLGSISTGKWADFVILDSSLPQTLDERLLQLQVEATYIAGDAVYQRGQASLAQQSEQ